MMKKSSDPKSMRLSELHLVFSVTEFLVAEGYRVRLEVSNMGQSIDVVATKNRWITAIEAKLSNWQRALDQCRAHGMVADYVVLALAMKRPPQGLLDLLDKQRWGLLLFDTETHSWRWAIRPRRNDKVWKPQRDRFTANLRKVDYVA